MQRLACALVLVVASTTGCTLDFGGDDGGDDVCLRGGSALGVPVPSLVNPATLQCQSFATCDPQCGPCPPDHQRPPTWAYCGGACEGLAEVDCLFATECRAAYDYSCYTGTGPCTAVTPFLGCYGTDMTGPVEGPCTGLGAEACSQHNDCVALHTPQCSGETADCWQQFVECRDEGVSCWGPLLCDIAGPSCPPGETPVLRNGCYTGACVSIDACEPPPPGT